MRGRGPRWVRPWPAAALLFLAASCVPRPVGVALLEVGEYRNRYETLLLARERAATMVQARVTLWPKLAESRASGADPVDEEPRRLPALEADLVLAWPDVLRLRVASLFGTALDVGASGDSIVAWVPSARAGVVFDAVRDSLGFPDPGSLAVRAWSAGWRPPAEAWVAASPAEDGLTVRWSEGEDSVAMVVDREGRPMQVEVRRSEAGIRVVYQRWERAGGIEWPVALRLEDLAGPLRLAGRVERVKFAPRRDARLAVRIPEDAERLDLTRLRRYLRSLAGAP